MISSFILAIALGQCSGGTCTAPRIVHREVTRTRVVERVVQNEAQPVRKAVKRVRSLRVFRRH